MLVEQWEKALVLVAKALYKAADQLEQISQSGEVSFKDISEILAVLAAASAVARLVPDSLETLRTFTKEST